MSFGFETKSLSRPLDGTKPMSPAKARKLVACAATRHRLGYEWGSARSTLFMLVSALMGLEVMRKAYAHAIDKCPSSGHLAQIAA